MSGGPEHLDPRTGGLAGGMPLGKPSEDVILDWVDGRLDAPTVARLSAVYPEIERQVRAMKRDARVLRAAAGEPAPADLAARIESHLGELAERETLFGGERSDSLRFPAEIAGAGLREHRVEEHVAFDWRRYRPAFAAAAAVVFLASGVLVFNSVRRGPTPQPLASDIGIASAPEATTIASRPADPLSESTAVPAAAPITALSGPASTLAAAGANEITEPTIAAREVGSVPVATVTAELTPAAALAYAREQRLVVRVYANEARAISRAETGRDADGTVNYRLSKKVPSRVVAAVAPPVETFAWPRRTSREELAIASDRTRGDGIGATLSATGSAAADLPDTFSTPAPQTRTYLADLRGTPESLAAMQTTLETQLKGTAEFEVLDAPLALQLPADPGSVLWWTQSPAEWAERYVVPVVIEER